MHETAQHPDVCQYTQTFTVSRMRAMCSADLSLVTGNTVRNAFRIGVTSIMAESSAAQVGD